MVIYEGGEHSTIQDAHSPVGVESLKDQVALAEMMVALVLGPSQTYRANVRWEYMCLVNSLWISVIANLDPCLSVRDASQTH